MSRFISANADSSHQEEEEDSKWLAAQAAIEATRTKPRLEPGSQEGGKSLFETLQANKEKKQAAYEESLRITNQFQSLDEDDVEFLDSVLESEREKEAAVKRETKARLEAFRVRQLELEKQNNNTSTVSATQDGHGKGEEEWTVSRKRKKEHSNKLASLGGGVKLRKTSSSTMAEMQRERETADSAPPADNKPTNTPAIEPPPPSKISKIVTPPAPPPPPSTTGLGLGAYSSSDEDD